MNYRYVRLMAVLMLLCSVLPFGVTSEAAPPGADPIELREVTFAHGLTDDMQAIDPDPAAAFTPDETIYLALVIKGRPKSGLVAAHFYWGDDFMAEVAVDLADVNSGLLFSFGQDTYVGYNLSYDDSLIISDKYRAEVFYEGEPLGVYPFRVIPRWMRSRPKSMRSSWPGVQMRTITRLTSRMSLTPLRRSSWSGTPTWALTPGYRPTGT